MARTTKDQPATLKPKKPAAPPKFWRDIDAYTNGQALVPSKQSPICAKCGLDTVGCSKNPYLKAIGSVEPIVTVVFESVSGKEDRAGTIACEGSRNGLVKQHIEKIAKTVGLDVTDIRYTAMTLCANTSPKKIDYKIRGNWCRAHLIRDLAEHRPTVIIPVGTAVLGRLSHKSNAQDWAGKMLTYRGWPDDWLTEKKYDAGSPFTGSRPGDDLSNRVLMAPIQAPYIVWAAQNPTDIARWKKHIRRGLELAVHGTTAMNYDRPWFRIETTADGVVSALREIPDGVRVAYDLETTGLLAFAEDAGIVFAMFRWVDPVDGGPRAVGFPWLYDGSPITRADVVKIIPEWKRVLYRTKLVGHNVSFDLIYTYARLPDIDLVQMTKSLDADTRMMLYARRQTRESLGLEIVAYDWCPDMAGYEEEFELLKRREPALLDPAEGEGGHYANVPRDKWSTHLKPYVMGDVEVAYVSCESIEKELAATKRYKIPLADPDHLGSFRQFEPPGRDFMYRKFMVPAQRVLTRVMARGMHVDTDELSRQEDLFPKLIRESREKLRHVDPRILAWCQQQEATVPGWDLDLENREQLSTILFEILQCPVKRLTDGGVEKFGEEFTSLSREQQVQYAAIDKFTLNALAAEHPELAPLQEYRKLYKAYTAFVRSMRNITVRGIDKKERTKSQYLQADGRVHTNFNQAGTRSGRLSSCVAGDTMLLTNKGLVEIQDLSVANSQQVSICTHANRFRRIKRLFTKGVQPMYSVRTECGASICCTADHRFLTSKGWRRLGDIQVGGGVLLDPKWKSKDQISNREIVQDSLAGAQVKRQADARYRGVPEAIGAIKEILEEAEPDLREAMYAAPPATFVSKVSRQPKGCARSVHSIGQGKVRNFAGQRSVKSSYSEGIWNDRILCRQEYRALLIDKISREVVAISDDSGFTVCGNREDLSGYFEGSKSLGNRSKEFCGEHVHGLLPASNVGRIREDVFAVFDRLRQNVGPNTSMDFMVVEQVRDATGRGFTGCWNTVYSGADGIERQEHESRFRSCGDQHFNRGRRELSYFGIGQRKGPAIGESRVESDEISAETSDVRHYFSGYGDSARSGRIESITYVGNMDVWDVEVEEDHSYAAGGFINHNSQPNLQQLPIDSIVKKMYASRFGSRLGAIMVTDLSQIELRLLAAACGDPLMVRAYREKLDLHSLTASKVFKTPYEHFTKDYMADLQKRGHEKEAKKLDALRKIAKTTNFLTGYGGGAYGLQTTLSASGIFIPLDGKDEVTCEKIVEGLFDTYPMLRKHIGLYKRFILENACAVSITGRVRVFEEVFSEDKGIVNKALRSGFNHLIQSTASDIMLTCMAVIEHLMREANLQSVLVSTVHDSIVVDALRSELPIVHEICSGVVNNIPLVMRQVMGPAYDAAWMDVVPLEGDSEVGPSYGSQFKIVPDVRTGEVDWDALFNRKAA